MKINSTLEKNLLKYSAMASGVIAMGSTANAQITYYDEDPDAVITGHQQGLVWDFDGDTNDDIAIIAFDASATGSYSGYNYTQYYKAIVAAPYSGAAIRENVDNEALLMNTGNVINSLGAFNSGTQVLLAGDFMWQFGTSFPYGTSFTQAAGDWAGATDKYMGIRFTGGGNVHFGWMRMDVDATATTVTIKDWAFNSVPDGAINAGQMVGVAENAGELALIRYNNNRLDINVVKGTAGNLAIVNMEGKVVYTKGISNSMESVDLSNLSAGLYIVNAEFTEGGVQHKIVIR